ncbi:MAG: hypothetical protein JWP37_3487 [Mucilaginibacter sp.]|nr:hypothetical protein [Mucilaginibacter sp.]
MKSLAELNKEASEIQLEMRKLLLNNYNIDDGIADKLIVITTITNMRTKLSIIQREIRIRSSE